MFLKALLIAHSIPLTQDVVNAVLLIGGQLPPSAAAAGLRFLKASIRWASSDAPVDQTPPVGSAVGSPLSAAPGDDNSSVGSDQRHSRRIAQLHGVAARLAVLGGPELYPDAQRHFLEAELPNEFAG